MCYTNNILGCMKKMLTFIGAAVLLLCLACSITVKSESKYYYTDDGYTYTINDKNEVCIERYGGTAEELTVPAIIDGRKVTSIGNNAFSYSEILTSVSLPDGVTSIGNSAFSDCVKLTNISLPDGLTHIGHDAFAFIYSLTSINLPDSLTSIVANPFVGCGKLTQINVSKNHPVLEVIDGVLFNKKDKTLICYPYAFTAESYIVPTGVLGIGDSAFAYCLLNLTSITLPETVTSIGDHAFHACERLTNISLSDNVTSIGYSAFSYCSRLTSIMLPNSLISIDSNAFSDCDNLTSVIIPAGVMYIGDSVFRDSPNVNLLVQENSYAHKYAKDSNLEYQLMATPKPSSHLRVANLNQSECYIIPNSIECQDFGIYAKIPDMLNGRYVTGIGEYALAYTKSIDIQLPDTIEWIDNNAFEGSLISTIFIPTSVKEIGEEAFLNCENLQTVVIPSSVTSMGSEVFKGCNSQLILKVEIDSYAEEYCWEYGLAYEYCDIEEEQERSKARSKTLYKFEDYIFYLTENDSIVIVGYEGASTDVLLPEQIYGYPVKGIGSYACSGNLAVTSITIPTSGTAIG